MCVYAMHIIVLCVYARLSKMNTSVFPPPLPAWLLSFPPLATPLTREPRHVMDDTQAPIVPAPLAPSPAPSAAAACVFVCAAAAAAAAVSWCNNLA